MDKIRHVKLSDISQLITKGTTPTTVGFEFQNFGVSFLKIECFDENGNYIPEKTAHISEECNEKLKRSQLKAGDILFSIAGAIGRVAVITEEMLPANTNQALAIIRIDRDDVYLPYVTLILSSPLIKTQFEKKKQGVAQLNISLKDVNDLEIPLPEYPQQVSFVDAFDKVRRIIQDRKKELQSLDDLINARFVEMFGDPLINTYCWETMPIISVCKKIFGGGTPSKNHPEYFEGDIPWVSPKDMKSEVITDSIDHITKEAIANSTTSLVPANSVLMVIRSGILKHSLPVAINAVPVTINQDMKAFVPGENITASFLRNYFHAIESDVLSGVRGVTADNIEFKAFQMRQMIMPPLSKQKEFELFCQQVDKSKAVVQKALDEAQLLFDSLMQQFFG